MFTFFSAVCLQSHEKNIFQANKTGQDFGDEYFAELDLIEVIEGRKEGKMLNSVKIVEFYSHIFSANIS